MASSVSQLSSQTKVQHTALTPDALVYRKATLIKMIKILTRGPMVL